MDPTLLVLRWAHVLAAIVALGAVIFARFGLLPALAELDEETRERIHDRIRRAWLTVTIGTMLAVVLLSGWMRQLHTGPNLLAAGESGVRMDTTAGEGRRERGGDADGQEGQEADRGAAAEDREAPAAAGGGQEAAR